MLTLTDDVCSWLLERIPDPPISAKGGRPALDKARVLRGIFWILDNGAKWKDLPRAFGAKSAVHRHFQRWVRDGVFERVLREAGRVVEERDGFRLYECFMDGMFSKAKGGGDGVGLTKAGKGVKIMILVDAQGLPVSIDTMSATPHESRLVQRLFDFMLTSGVPERVIGDKAYDDDGLAAELAQRGTELIAPHRSNRVNITQDGRPLRRYKRRWTVERTIAWIQHFRRLCIRWEKSTKLFRGFLHLACTILLIRQV
ncbi:Transposase DDE domain protein [Phycisphaerae bacterium RAS1]|nr:Transposase DDE domain protein [Phycisphaerae bacterium RAS1]TWT43996.1 Transposase DDE domain protein [Phycisphaerae bacterium RAS1]TWT45058.1 Transposase DDE domain protein [Phycisphaerae bacterium RAS1]TWT45327.1 Transposase DDE domain protein [Phycisphaerae bacterium RAS1]